MAVGYIRVSTEDQRLGPDAQRAQIEAWAAREGVHVAAWHVETGVSGAAPIVARAGLMTALASLHDHDAGLLVVAKRDRIARDVVIAAMVERACEGAGARLVSAAGEANGDSPADAFMRTVLDAASAYERALIRARTAAALDEKRKRGEKLGGRAPYGWRVAADGVHLEMDPEEQATIATVHALRETGHTQREVMAAATRQP